MSVAPLASRLLHSRCGAARGLVLLENIIECGTSQKAPILLNNAFSHRSLLRGRGCAADWLVLLPVQRPVLLGAVPHGATRGTAFVLLHGRLPLVAQRQGAFFQAMPRNVRAPVCCLFSTICTIASVVSSKPRSRRIRTVAAAVHFMRSEAMNATLTK